MDAVINAFAKGNVPIERLSLHGRRFFGENLMTINTLKKMKLSIDSGPHTVREILLRAQPALEDISVEIKHLETLMGQD